jgi:hypothetical protein
MLLRLAALSSALMLLGASSRYSILGSWDCRFVQSIEGDVEHEQFLPDGRLLFENADDPTSKQTFRYRYLGSRLQVWGASAGNSIEKSKLTWYGRNSFLDHVYAGPGDAVGSTTLCIRK